MMKDVDRSAARRMARASQWMRRALLASLSVFALVAATGVAQAQAVQVIQDFQAGPCAGTIPTNTCDTPYTQAAGHPNWAVTGFSVATNPDGTPVATLKDVRTDIPAGLISNPQATSKMCTETQLAAFDLPDPESGGAELPDDPDRAVGEADPRPARVQHRAER